MALTETKYGKFYYFAQDAIGQSIASGAFWDEHLRPWIDKLGPRDVMVDVGANIGFFTVYCALHGVWVWAFEASPEVFELLKRNVQLNKVELTTRLENVALYDKETELTLNPEWNDWPRKEDGRVDYEHHNNSGGLSLIQGTGSVYETKSRTLDSYQLQQLSLLKVDVQGADLRVLVGAKETVKKYRPVVCFELEPIPARLHGDNEEACRKFLADLDYDVQVVRAGMHGVKDFVAVPRG